MTVLDIDAFPRFFAAVHPHSPFRWQTRLAEEVAAARRFPDLADLPTGSGKTALLDIAVFLQALDAAAAPAERWVPRRVVLVVDRRVVVDQAAARAERIAGALRQAPPGSVLGEVAAALRGLGGGELPLVTAQLRGGIARDDGWARRADQPTLIASTVDQVGSRLLFRGYGVSAGMAPVHAGLLANDCLFLLDEVHLSQPFAETLAALASRYRALWPSGLPDRWQVVQLSATPGGAHRGDRVFRLEGDADDPALAPRLKAPKPTATASIKVPTRDPAVADSRFAQRCASEAARLVGSHRTVGVLVNRVDTARRVASLVSAGEAAPQVLLLTGRMRDLDRDDLLDAHRGRIAAGRIRSNEDEPLVVVATQCLEAGADVDLDALVTECASLDALKQRFGRLDRLGQLRDQGLVAQGLVLARSDRLDGADVVYGEALSRTWTWLETQASLDFGVSALAEPSAAALGGLVASKPRAPVLLPAHLDAWAQTRPRPEVEPEVAPWLHGLVDADQDVQVVWRADLDDETLDAPDTVDLLSLVPPSTGEAMSVPLRAVRAWLAGGAAPAVADVEGSTEVGPDERPGDAGQSRRAVRWEREASRVVTADEVRPGDTIVVPSSRGGIEAGVWAPGATEAVVDLGDRAALANRGRPTLRLDDRVLPPSVPDAPRPPGVEADESGPGERAAAVDDWLREVAAGEDLPSWLRDAARRLVGVAPRVVAGRYVLVARKGREPLDSSGDGSSFTAVEVRLTEHLEAVADAARDVAARLGLAPGLVDDLALAGRLHDLGKGDPRFQRWLHGGDEVAAALADEPLAKSAVPSVDRRARRLAREASGWPAGGRHELISLALVEGSSLLADAHDADLVLHLVAAHHGWCRPLAPVVPDPCPTTVEGRVEDVELRASSAHGAERLDSGVAERFWRLVDRYGWFGLAWLEAVFRLADHAVSEREQDVEEEGRG